MVLGKPLVTIVEVEASEVGITADDESLGEGTTLDGDEGGSDDGGDGGNGDDDGTEGGGVLDSMGQAMNGQ